jgi:hypothetical protein
MTAAQFRSLALSFAGVSESAHMNHPDFRVAGKIFATLGYPDAEHATVILPPDEQARLTKSYPKVFTVAKGAWGKQGSTSVCLKDADNATVKAALEVAWLNRLSRKRS